LLLELAHSAWELLALRAFVTPGVECTDSRDLLGPAKR
jgi:hypothetical protein